MENILDINTVIDVFNPLYETGLNTGIIKVFEAKTRLAFNKSQSKGDDLDTSLLLAADEAANCLESLNPSH